MFPALQQFLRLRQDPKAYFIFCDYFLWSTNGARRFDDQKVGAPISRITTVCDEAVTLLFLENSWIRWVARRRMMDETGSVNKNLLPPMAYTSAGPTTGGVTGWSDEGLHRFRELHKLVAKDRNAPHARDVEARYLAICQQRMTVGATSNAVRINIRLPNAYGA